MDNSWWFGSGVATINWQDRYDDTINYHKVICDGISKYKFYVSYVT